MTLAEFLLARYAEDEAWADWLGCCPYDEGLDDGWAGAHWPAARVLAECEAKRTIVQDCEVALLREETSGAVLAHHILNALSIPHRDHPDYDPAWRLE